MTVGRSDFLRQLSIIENLIDEKIDLKIIITGSHSKKIFGNTIYEIKNRKIKYYNCCPKKYFIDSKDLTKNIRNCIEKIDQVFKKDSPNILVLFGDRYEVLAAAIAAFGKNILIVHVHGGSVTLGSFDDQIRHSLTKLSHIHLTSHNDYVKRIIQLGEEKWRIKNLGAPGLDVTKKFSKKLNNVFINKFIFNTKKKYILFCFHPETTNLKKLNTQLKELKKVLLKIQYKIIITYPSSDPGSEKIISFFKKMVSKNKNKFIFIKNISEDYYFLLKNCEFVLGNSSSGIVEAATFYKPVVNIGSRQLGKIIPKNVLCCEINKDKIFSKIQIALDKKFQNKIKKFKNPYGTGNSGRKISKFLKNLNINDNFFQKKFIDI